MKTVYVFNKVGHFLSKVYTIKDAAQALGIHPKTLRRWEEKGKFIPLRTPGNQRRFTNKDLNLLTKIKAGDTPAPPLPKLLTAQEAAVKLQVSLMTLDRWTKAGKLKIRVTDRLEPRYLETDIKAILQGPSLKATEEKPPAAAPTGTDPVVRYSGIAAAGGVLLLAAWLLISRPDRPASPAVLETQTPTVDVALPRTAQFLDGRITLGLDTGDLFYADSGGNLYVKNSALIDQGVYTRSLQFLPTGQPQDQQIGQMYVDQASGNLKYFDGLDWIDLNRNASNSATSNQFPSGLTSLDQDIDLTLGDLNASASAASLRITLAGDQSVVKILGGAGQDILTVNDDALYPVLLSQPTQIIGNLLAPKLIDADQTAYFLDPSSETVSLAVAGDATISSTLKFSKYGEYITNSVDDYLIFSGGFGVGGSSSYGFNAEQKLNARAVNIENGLTVSGNLGLGTDINNDYKLNINGNVYVNGDITASGAITPDYVFEPGYELLSPVDLKEYISIYQHLPGVPSAAEVRQNGLNLQQMLMAVLEKTEENTLYILDLYDRSGRIISPTVETEVLTTKFISPLADGQITIQGDASISGTLYAQEINSSTIDKLREKIQELTRALTSEEPSSVTSEVAGTGSSEVDSVATAAANLDTPLPATDSAYLSLSSLESDIAFFKDYLAVLGQAVFTNATINNTLAVSSITGLDGRLNLLAEVTIDGSLTIAGPLTVNEINTPIDQELAVRIATGSALSIYSEISPLATFSGQTVSLANLTLETSGSATISAGANAGLIRADQLSEKSQIIVTFTSDSKPADKYWVKKDPAAGQFTLFVNYPVNLDTTFDWLMVN